MMRRGLVGTLLPILTALFPAASWTETQIDEKQPGAYQPGIPSGPFKVEVENWGGGGYHDSAYCGVEVPA